MVASKLMLFLLVLFCNILVCLEATIYNPFFFVCFCFIVFLFNQRVCSRHVQCGSNIDKIEIQQKL